MSCKLKYNIIYFRDDFIFLLKLFSCCIIYYKNIYRIRYGDISL